MKEKIYRAGLIPYIIENDEIKMLFMKPSDTKYGGSKYQIAKGKLEKGETNKDAAIREAGEELGFTMLNIDGNLYDIGNFLGRTRMYMCKIKDKNMFTDFCDETKSVKWMSSDDFQENGRSIHKPIIKAVLRKIKTIENI